MTFTNERSAFPAVRFFSICLVFLLLFNPGHAQTGTTWTARTYPAENSWVGVAYGNNLFVAIASSGTGNRVMTSPDGITWTIRTTPAGDNVWAAITYGDGKFVAVGAPNVNNANSVMTSPDGINWTLRVPGNTTSQWVGITYANSTFVAVAQFGTVRAMTSPDGITWTDRPSLNAAHNWTGITYGNGKFVAVALDAPLANPVAWSTDGVTWTQVAAPGDGWYGVTYGDNKFVAVRGGSTSNRAMTSPDGITWTLQATPVSNNWRVVRYGGGLFVSAAITGTGNRIMTSPDGIAWTARNSTADVVWRGLAYGNGIWVATATSGTGTRVMTSGSIATPVTWLSFTGEAAGSSNNLSWKTATESNNARFEIERSGDNAVFVKIGEVAPADNAINGAAYSFTDRSPLSAKTYYRIKQVDKDGRFEFSKTVTIDGGRTTLLSVYPNPVRDVLTVKGLADNSKSGRFTISNAAGLQVKAGVLPANQSINIQTLPAGQYVFRIGERAVHFTKL